MLDKSNAKVFWFVVALIAIGIVTTIIIASLTGNQEAIMNNLKRTENY